jgi:hypothetical protein
MLVETPSPRHVSSRSRVGISSPLRFHHSFGSGLLWCCVCDGLCTRRRLRVWVGGGRVWGPVNRYFLRRLTDQNDLFGTYPATTIAKQHTGHQPPPLHYRQPNHSPALFYHTTTNNHHHLTLSKPDQMSEGEYLKQSSQLGNINR